MIWRYIRWSNFKISIDLNPFCWSFKYFADHDDPTFIYIRLLAFSFLLVIDDGIYNDGRIVDPMEG
jgi:hypothetical protein